jgi:hypothetical protein
MEVGGKKEQPSTCVVICYVYAGVDPTYDSGAALTATSLFFTNCYELDTQATLQVPSSPHRRRPPHCATVYSASLVQKKLDLSTSNDRCRYRTHLNRTWLLFVRASSLKA